MVHILVAYNFPLGVNVHFEAHTTGIETCLPFFGTAVISPFIIL